MSLEILRESRKGATVVFTAFTTMKKKYNDTLFCCFEGDDAKYYFKRIEDRTGYPPEKIVAFACDGKIEVLRFYRIIKGKSEYASVKLLYFIDRDFDKPVDDESYEIYETPVYSIENLYTTFEAFVRILKVEFLYSEADLEYEILSTKFKERQVEFHEKTTYLNSWIACQRDKSSEDSTIRLNLSSFSLKTLVTEITLDYVTTNYDKNKLESLFPDAFKLDDEVIKKKVELFSRENRQEIFRGKFEIDFLYEFLEAIKREYNLPAGRIKKKQGVQLNQSKKNMISEFSQYATTRKCLISYLEEHKTA